MKALICFFIFSQVLRAAADLRWLVVSEYPRIVKWSRREDAIGVALGIGFAAWGLWLLR